MLAEHPYISILTNVFSLIGIYDNFLIFGILLETKFGSQWSSILLCNQCFFAGFACSIVLTTNLSKLDARTTVKFIDVILCYLTSHLSVFWLAEILYVHNLVCLTIERVIAIWCPICYRSSQKLLITLTYVYLSIMVLFLYTPLTLNREFYSNGTCGLADDPKAPWRELILRIHTYLWFVLIYAAPALVMFCNNIIIIRKLRQKQISFSWTSSEGVLSNPVTRLSMTTVVLVLLHLTFYAYDSIKTLRLHVNNIKCEAGSSTFNSGVLVILVGFSLNPCVLLLMNAELKRRFTKMKY
ncbi:uncharacterized protein DEA37_0012216 [Paragonimus westermani]|uniref:G-protein coupled receptors family 1 profile domain-containing protein n=1 Tax=Paragonimus westermani TaxID=34504 RepID=A0A5J4NGB4_9TREM|nr:uncharacterized protein DEA37_0012216 [Paragonimus westermani]